MREFSIATGYDSGVGLRYRALISVSLASGGRQGSEVAAANMRDLRRISDKRYIYRLEHSKTQQAGVTASATPDKPVLDRAALALEEWLDAAGLTEGAIFRSDERRVGKEGVSTCRSRWSQ